MKLPGSPVLKVAVFALVMIGAWFTTWLMAGLMLPLKLPLPA